MLSERVEVGVVPPERSLERAGLVADKVAVDDARAGFEAALGVEGLFGRFARGPSNEALRVRSMKGFGFSTNEGGRSSCDSSIAASSLLDGLIAGADGTMGITSMLPRSLSSNKGTSSRVNAFLPAALVMPVTACLATETVVPGMTTFPSLSSFPAFRPSVDWRHEVTAIADKHAARSSSVSGAGRPFALYTGGAVPVAAAVLARIEATADLLGGASTNLVATA